MVIEEVVSRLPPEESEALRLAREALLPIKETETQEDRKD